MPYFCGCLGIARRDKRRPVIELQTRKNNTTGTAEQKWRKDETGGCAGGGGGQALAGAVGLYACRDDALLFAMLEEIHEFAGLAGHSRESGYFFIVGAHNHVQR